VARCRYDDARASGGRARFGGGGGGGPREWVLVDPGRKSIAMSESVSTDSLAMPAQTAPTGRRLRLAFIGCGGVLRFHMNALKHVPEIEVVAGCDIDPARLEALGRDWGVTRHFTDWNQMIREVKPDAVSVCTPNGLHMQPVIDAANAGCHVIVEKPMAMNPEQCQRMVDAAKKNTASTRTPIFSCASARPGRSEK
jgi:hypothetical protein